MHLGSRQACAEAPVTVRGGSPGYPAFVVEGQRWSMQEANHNKNMPVLR